MSWGHLAAGAVALALLQPLLKAATDSGSGVSSLAKLAQVPAVVVSRFMDPTVAAFPGGTSPTTAAAASAVTAAGTAGAAASSSLGSVAFGSPVAPYGGAGNTPAPNTAKKWTTANFPE